MPVIKKRRRICCRKPLSGSFTYIHQYKFNGPLAGWIRRIVINAALKILQSKKIQFAEIGEEEYPLSSIDPDALSNLT